MSEDAAIAIGFALVILLAGVIASVGAWPAAAALGVGYLMCFGVLCAWRKWL